MRISVVLVEGALPVWRDTREGLLEPGHTLYVDVAWVDEVSKRKGRKLDKAPLVREYCVFDLAIMPFGGSMSCTRANVWRRGTSIGTEFCVALLLFSWYEVPSSSRGTSNTHMVTSPRLILPLSKSDPPRRPNCARFRDLLVLVIRADPAVRCTYPWPCYENVFLVSFGRRPAPPLVSDVVCRDQKLAVQW